MFIYKIKVIFITIIRAGRPVFFWNRFIEPVPLSNRFIGTGSIFEPVSFSNRFIQTGFYWETGLR